MKILIISDIHGITENLNILDKIIFDKLICLGDIYSYGISSEDEKNNLLVEEKLKQYQDKLICLRGNCDYPNHNLFALTDLYKDIVDNHKLYFTHGNRYSYSKGYIDDTNYILIYGHEHVPYIKKESNNSYICVGSLSKPRYGSVASYAIYENNMIYLYNINGTIIDSINI